MEGAVYPLASPKDQAYSKELMLDSLNDAQSPPSLLLNNRQPQCVSPSSMHSTSASEKGSESVLSNYSDLRNSLSGMDSDISSISPSPKLPLHHVARTRDLPGKFTIRTRASPSPRLSFHSTSDLSRSDTSFSMLSTTLSSDAMFTPRASNDEEEQPSEILGDLSNVDEYVMTSSTQSRPPTPPCNLLDIPRSRSVSIRDIIPSPVHSCRLNTFEDSQLSDTTMDEEFSSDAENLTTRAYHSRKHSFTSITTPRKHRCKYLSSVERSASFSVQRTRPELSSGIKESSPLVTSFSITGSTPLVGDAHESSHYQRDARSECAVGNPRMTNTYTLPNKEQDHGHRLITPATFHDLTMGKYSDTITNVTIVDCRSIKEYTAGHIINAINIPVPHSNGSKFRYLSGVYEALEKNFFPPASNAQSTAVIFYCEFSSYRGPTGATMLKKLDSNKLKEQNSRFGSSARHYPQVYVLEGGYSSYFQTFPDGCFPRAYLPESVANPRRTLPHTQSFSSLPGRLQF